MAPLFRPPIYNTLRHLPEDKIRWTVAVFYAQDARREAPWYPAWEQTARKLDRIEHRERSITVPLICSQQPITFEIDSVEKLGDNGVPLAQCDDGAGLLSVDSPNNQPGSLEARVSESSPSAGFIFSEQSRSQKQPLTPKSGFPGTTVRLANHKPPNRFRPPTDYPNLQRMSTAELFRIPSSSSSPPRPWGDNPSQSSLTEDEKKILLPSLLPPSSEPNYSSSPPRRWEDNPGEPHIPSSSNSVPGTFVRASTTGPLTEDEKTILAHANSLRSTRIPDLLRRIFKLWSTGEASIFDLIIEIKKADFLLFNGMATLRRQVLNQAEHIFAADPMVQSIGCILAIGNRWRYEEAYRSTINSAVTAMETDSDYVQGLSDPNTSSTGNHSPHPHTDLDSDGLPSNNFPPQTSTLLQRFTSATSMISFCDPDSDELFAVVYERLKTLNPSYWSDVGAEQVGPGVLHFETQFEMDTDQYAYGGDKPVDAILDEEECGSVML